MLCQYCTCGLLQNIVESKEYYQKQLTINNITLETTTHEKYFQYFNFLNKKCDNKRMTFGNIYLHEFNRKVI